MKRERHKHNIYDNKYIKILITIQRNIRANIIPKNIPRKNLEKNLLQVSKINNLIILVLRMKIIYRYINMDVYG